MASDGYLRALRFPALTRVYDPVIRLTIRERRFKELLVQQAAPAPGQRVLDLGCGTGTLAIEVKRSQSAAEVAGLDARSGDARPGPGQGRARGSGDRVD
jgi:ubiquinone/menaquinone biosynthesis C-methylase UbiE